MIFLYLYRVIKILTTTALGTIRICNSDWKILVIEKLGFKNINYLDAGEHDEIIAFTSQLTHAIAVSLINSDDNKYDTNKFIGDSYRDLTRIAKINEDLWAELFLGNKDNLLFMIEKFEKRLDVLKEAVKSEDIETLKKEFRESSRRREQITWFLKNIFIKKLYLKELHDSFWDIVLCARNFWNNQG